MKEPKTVLDAQFNLGYLIACAHVARRGSDTIAMEMLVEIGVTKVEDLVASGLTLYDLKPLCRVLKQAA